MKKKLLLGFVLSFLCVQLVRPTMNTGMADTKVDITHYVQVPGTIMNILKRCCYDCHSNNTVYPWYSHVTPIGFWLNKHVEEGKAVFNFSDFSGYSKPQIRALLQRIGKATADKTVPLKSYLLLHKDAAPTEKEIQAILRWTAIERQRLTAP